MIITLIDSRLFILLLVSINMEHGRSFTDKRVMPRPSKKKKRVMPRTIGQA